MKGTKQQLHMLVMTVLTGLIIASSTQTACSPTSTAEPHKEHTQAEGVVEKTTPDASTNDTQPDQQSTPEIAHDDVPEQHSPQPDDTPQPDEQAVDNPSTEPQVDTKPVEQIVENNPPEQSQPDQPTPQQRCAPLPAPKGTIVRVKPSQGAKLPSMIAQAKANTTFLLENGTYKMTGSESQRRIQIKKPGITIRSASGDASKVIIDGEYKTQEIIFIAADDVTIAEITIRQAKYHLIHITGNANGHVMRPNLYRLRLLDGGQQFVKVNSCCSHKNWVDKGVLACSELTMTDNGRKNVETRFAGGCYTGGIDAHGAKDWVVRDNTFKGIYCKNGGLAEHAIHFWRASWGTLSERNIIINCARGIGYGLGKNKTSSDRVFPNHPYPNVSYAGHIDGIIRNNLIHTDASVKPYYDTGIELEQAHGVEIYHNTLASPSKYTGLSYRFANTKALIQNNLIYRLSKRDNAKGTVSHNLTPVPTTYFVNPSKVDYHLTSKATKAIGKGTPQKDPGLDLDGKQHNPNAPDLGAYAK